MSRTELDILRARVSLLERKLDAVLRNQGMPDEDLPNFELDAAVEISRQTLDYTPIKEVLRRQIEREGRLKKADAGKGRAA